MIHAALVAAILSLSPFVGHDRAADIATGMAGATSSIEDGILLVVTDGAESSFRRSVERCRSLHDKGAGWTAYGLHRQHLGRGGPLAACESPTLAAQLALVALSRGRTIRDRVAAFMGRRLDDPEVTRRVNTFDRLLAAAHAAEGES